MDKTYFDSLPYRKYAQETIDFLENINNNVTILDPKKLSKNLKDTIFELNESKKDIAKFKKRESDIITDAEQVYNRLTTNLEELQTRLDKEIKLKSVLDPSTSQVKSIHMSKEWVIDVVDKLVFGIEMGTAALQIFYLGDVVQGSMTATGAIMTRSSNKAIKTTGFLLASSGIMGSVVSSHEIILSLNEIVNTHISKLTSTANSFVNATPSNIVNLFRNSIDTFGQIKGNIFEWVGSQQPEISGLISQGTSTDVNVGFSLTNETIKILDQSPNLYNNLLYKIALKTPSHLEVVEPDNITQKLFTEAIAQAFEKSPSSGLGTIFNNALSFIWKSKSDIGVDVLLTVGVDVLATLVEFGSAGTIPSEAVSEISKKMGRNIGAAEIRILLENANTYLQYAK